MPALSQSVSERETASAQARSSRPRVVVVGAGFGGLEVVRALKDAPVDVLLIDRNNYHTFQPLLYQVATAALEPEEVAHAARGIFQKQRGFDFRMATVCGVDWDARTLRLEEGAPVAFDYLVLAAGASTNTLGVEGVEEHAFDLKSLDGAVGLRGHIIRQFEKANADSSLVDDGALNFVLVGGGPTGVEMAGALVELFDLVLAKDFPHLDVSRARVILAEAGPGLLASFDESLQAYTAETLSERGVEVRLERAVEEVTPGGVRFSDGEELRAETVLWAAGVKANPLADAFAQALDLEQTKGGRLAVGPSLEVPGHPGLYVVGDMAGDADSDGALRPQLAPVAIQGGRHVARAIQRDLAGAPAEAFSYLDKGKMATIGRGAAVAELPLGLKLRGFLAWQAWALIHLMQLVGFRNRLNVYINWVWNYFTYDRSARLIMEQRGDAVGSRPGSLIDEAAEPVAS